MNTNVRLPADYSRCVNEQCAMRIRCLRWLCCEDNMRSSFTSFPSWPTCAAWLPATTQPTEPTQPTKMNNHEDSREAFEKAHTDFQLNLNRDVGLKSFPDYYYNSTVQHMWQAWTRALDWRDAQVCEWLESSEEWDTRCEASYSREWPASPYCPNCGRRVKIVEKQTNDTNKQ